MSKINRRDFITACGAFAATSALARPIRSDLAGIGSALGDSNGWDDSTAKLYIQDGLVGLWDGIENAGWGVHSPTTIVWKDLIGDLDILLPAADSFAADHLSHLSGTPMSLAPTDILGGTNLTMESVFSVTTDSATFYSVSSLAGSGDVDASGFRQYALRHSATGNRFCSRFSCGNGKHWEYSGLSSKNIEIPIDQKVSVVYAIDFNSGYCTSYINGIQEFNGRWMSAGPVAYTVSDNLKVFYGQPCSGYCLRLYNRALSPEEVAYNHQIDIERFGL